MGKRLARLAARERRPVSAQTLAAQAGLDPEVLRRWLIQEIDRRIAAGLVHRDGVASVLRSRGRSGRSESENAVVLLDHLSELGRRQPVRVQPAQVIVGRPTGDGAAFSDVNRNRVIDELCEQLSGGRHADTLDSIRCCVEDELGPVAGERNRAVLLRLDGPVRGEVQ